jgi:hypothetical protein
MEEKDPIEDKFRSSFSDYEKDPPVRAWENLVNGLHAEPVPGGFWSHLSLFSLFTKLPLGFYLTLSGITAGLFMTVFYFGFKDHHSLRGHAYVENARLQGGSAELFHVADKAMPWDSATHYRSAIIDKSGHFQFSRVEDGNYLLRVAPDEYGEEARRFSPSWYEKNATSDSCTLVVISGGDVSMEVHLLLNGEIAK